MALSPSVGRLTSFLAASPTPYQRDLMGGMVGLLGQQAAAIVAVAIPPTAVQLKEAGFTELKEDEEWMPGKKSAEGSLRKGGKYFYTRAASTIVAFTIGNMFSPGNGFKVVGAHTDSPVLKVKPISKKNASGYMQVGVECYGGGLWHTWFDRELSIAGCVIVETPGGGFERRLVHSKKPLLRIPNLCIHLQTADERAKLEVNKENHLAPILAMVDAELNKTRADAGPDGLDARHAPELLRLIAEEAGCAPEAIRDMDMTLYDVQEGQAWGATGEFYSSARLDNQVHCFTALEALREHAAAGLAEDVDVSVAVCFDHEEVGSDSTHGAGSPIMAEVVERVNACFGVGADAEAYKLSLRRSFVVSADVAHAVHPNYAAKHEANHGPLLNKGTVIKTNNNQRYATSVTTGFVIRELSRKASIGCQEFVVRNDCPCGSTIGPMIAAHTGIRTVDVGIASLSMHSVRETIGTADVDNSIALFLAFYKHFRGLDDSCKF